MLPPLRSQERVPYHFYLIHSFFNPSSTPAQQSIMSLTPSKMVLPTLKNRLRLRSIRLLCMSAPAAAKAISLFFSTSQRGKINSVMDSLHQGLQQQEVFSTEYQKQFRRLQVSYLSSRLGSQAASSAHSFVMIVAGWCLSSPLVAACRVV